MSLALCARCHVDNHRRCVAKQKAYGSFHRSCLNFTPFYLLTILLRVYIPIVSGIVLTSLHLADAHLKVFISETGDIVTDLSWYSSVIPANDGSRIVLIRVAWD
jgi:hypothetical protein